MQNCLVFQKKLSKTAAENQKAIKQQTFEISITNPKWITLITQAIVIMCIVLFPGKLI
jgi:hypothetical protein